ncbi:hypothetical protein CSA37_10830 [Candidatus Fermentibacteria bacterium]|nr:MAG: hypothetical protein CSA37_10830 [Candidatus Fermentibacteria bacterium]
MSKKLKGNLRILDINNLYSPAGGGIRVYHHQKMKWCRQNGIENFLAYPASADTRTEVSGGTAIGIKSPKLAGSGYYFFTNKTKLQNLIRELKPDIIELGSGIVVPDMVKEFTGGIPTFAYYHSNWPEALPLSVLGIGKGPIPVLFKRLASPKMVRGYKLLKTVFAASDYSLSKLREAGLSNIKKVPLGADPITFHPDRRSEQLRKDLGAVNGKKIALYMGRLAPEKGISVLLKAFRHLFQDENIIIVAAGGGHCKRKLQKAASAHPDKLKLISRINTRDQAAELMASADAFISAGPCETFSLATLEALDCGTPVVACREAAAAELVHQAEGNSTYAPWDSGEALADAIIKAINTPREKRRQFRDFAEQFTWNRCFTTITESCMQHLN